MFIRNRLREAASIGVPASELLTFIPVRCTWCRQVRKPSEVKITVGLEFACINRRRCQDAYKAANDAHSSKQKPAKRTTSRRKVEGNDQ